MIATITTDFSTPTIGSSTKPAASDPIAAPTVLTNVSAPAVSTSELNDVRNEAPTSVKKIPESSDTGSISGMLMRRMSVGCVIDARPNGASTDGNRAYEITVATAAAHARSAANRC